MIYGNFINLLIYLFIVFILVLVYLLYLIHIEIKARFYLAVKQRMIELESKQKK